MIDMYMLGAALAHENSAEVQLWICHKSDLGPGKVYVVTTKDMATSARRYMTYRSPVVGDLPVVNDAEHCLQGCSDTRESNSRYRSVKLHDQVFVTAFRHSVNNIPDT